MTTSVLAVGDDELDVGDDDDASPEAAEGLAHMGGLREITWLVHGVAWLAGSRFLSVPRHFWGRECQECSCLYFLSSYL